MKIRLFTFGLLQGLLLLFSQPLRSQTDSTGFDPRISALMNQVSQEQLGLHIQNLASADGHQTRVSYTEGNRWSVNYVKETFESFSGLSSVALDTFYATDAEPPHNSEPLFNVVATLEGRQSPDQVYIIGAHLDATANLDNSLNWETNWPTAQAPGADDNASGIAAVLEIARILSDSSNAFNSTFTVKFIAFGAEERHPAYSNNNHLGSRHFAEQAYFQGEDILGVYILDMIGFNSTGNHHFEIAANNKSRELGEKLLQMNSVYQIGLHANEPPFPEPTYSDHEAFWQYRYHAILVIENAPPWANNLPWYTANPFYHRQGDTFASVNLEQVAKVTKMTLAAVASLSGIVTGIQPEQSPLNTPASFSLFQNYPNPFNAGTRIDYQLRAQGNVVLTVLNLLGQQITTLVDKEQAPGHYSVQWDGKDARGHELPSGIYLYALEVGQRRVVRKMIFGK